MLAQLTINNFAIVRELKSIFNRKHDGDHR